MKAPGPVSTVSNNTNGQTTGDLARAYESRLEQIMALLLASGSLQASALDLVKRMIEVKAT